jgi:aryl-alcohol dehydrogenase-like predicted oxidoreductase
LWWGPQDRVESVRTIRTAVDAGVRWIDTSPFYGWGLAEELVADALAPMPQADRPLVLTKCGTFPPDNRTDASPAAIRAEVEGSLRRLRVDRLDLVQIHDEDPAVPIEESWGALMDLVTAGVIGAAGLSNHSVALMDRAIAVGAVSVVQHQYSLLDRTPEADGVLGWCDAHDVPFLAWSPLASGYLADGFDLAALHPTDLRHRLRWNRPEYQDRVRALRAELAEVAGELGCPMAAAAIAWVCSRPGRHAIVGARTPAEAEALASVPVLDAAARSRLA